MPRYARAPFRSRGQVLNWRLLMVLLITGCAAQAPLTKAGVSQGEFDQDRLHCQAQMYYQRASIGRSAPNWNLYEYCMRSRGYGR